MSNFRRSISCISIFVLFLIVTTGISFGATHTVINTDDSGPGSLRQTVEDALPGDVIIFDGMLNGRTILLTNDVIRIDKDLTIQGPGSDELTIDGVGSDSSAFLIDSDTTEIEVIISGMTLQFFPSNAIFLNSLDELENLTVIDLYFFDNTRGISNVGGGTLTVRDSVFEKNEIFTLSGRGGAINNSCLTGSCPNGSTLIVENSKFIDNFASFGGAIYSNTFNNPVDGTPLIKATASITDSTFSGNSTIGFGGAIYNGTGETTIENSEISGGLGLADFFFTGTGLAVYNGQGTTNIINTTISNNNVIEAFDTTAGGAAINNVDGTVNITNSTIVNNNVYESESLIPFGTGAGIFNANEGGVVNIKNSILASNGSAVDNNCHNFEPGSQFNDLGGNISDSNTDACAFAFNPDFDFATMLGPLQDNGGSTFTHALIETISPLNPAISGVSDCTLIGGGANTEDQIHQARPGGAGCDIGAYESDSLQPPPPPTLLLNMILPGISSNINEITAENATAEGNVAFLWGFFPGTLTVGGPRCNGLELDIRNPRILRIAGATSDGNARHIFFIPQIGDSLVILTQAVDIDTCVKSEVVSNIIRNL